MCLPVLMCLSVRLQVDINVSPVRLHVSHRTLTCVSPILMCLSVRLQVDINVSPRINVSHRTLTG